MQERIPQIWSVPNFNEQFEGRQGELASIQKKLNVTKENAVRINITGLPGVGKSQLAKKFAHMYRKNYSIVFWINAESSLSLEEGYIELARKFNINTTNVKFIVILDELKQKLRTAGQDWLIILDNAESSTLLEQFIPEQHSHALGHIIITSRKQIGKTEIKLGPLEPADATKYLINTTKQDDRPGAEIVAKRVRYFPLALSLAAGFICTHEMSFSEYIEFYNESYPDLAEREERLLKEGDAAAYNDYYTESVRSAFNLLMLKIKDPLSIDLLNLCSFLSPDNIPKFLIEKLLVKKGHPPKKGLIDALESLVIYKIIQRDYVPSEDKELKKFKDTYSIHRLLQDFICYRNTKENKLAFLTFCLEAISSDFEPNDQVVVLWQKACELISHSESVLQWSEQFEMKSRIIEQLLYGVLKFYLKRDQLNLAEKNLNRLVRCLPNTDYKMNTPEEFIVFAQYLIYRVKLDVANRVKTEEFATVKKLIEKIMQQITEHPNLSANHDEISAELKYNLQIARLEEGENELIKAKEGLLKELEIARKAGDKLQEDNCLCNLGTTCHKMKQFDEALKYFHMALDLNRDSNFTFPGIGYIYNAIGGAHLDADNPKRDLEQSRIYYSETLNVCQKLTDFSKTDRYTCWAHFSLVKIYCLQGNVAAMAEVKKHYDLFKIRFNNLYPNQPERLQNTLKDLDPLIKKLEEQQLQSNPINLSNNKSQTSTTVSSSLTIGSKETMKEPTELTTTQASTFADKIACLEEIKQILEKLNSGNEYLRNEKEIIEYRINDITNFLAQKNNFDEFNFIILIKSIMAHTSRIKNSFMEKYGRPKNSPEPQLNQIINLCQKWLPKKAPDEILQSGFIDETFLKREQERYQEQQSLNQCEAFSKMLQNIKNYAGRNYDPKKIFISYAWPIENFHKEEWSKKFALDLTKHLITAGLEVYIDQLHSGSGYPVYKFMHEMIEKADRIIVICNRTIKYKFDKECYRGSCYEYQEAIKKQRELVNITDNFIIPLSLTKQDNAPGLLGLKSDVSVYEDGYLAALKILIKSSYELGYDFDEFWNQQLLGFKADYTAQKLPSLLCSSLRFFKDADDKSSTSTVVTQPRTVTMPPPGL